MYIIAHLWNQFFEDAFAEGNDEVGEGGGEAAAQFSLRKRWLSCVISLRSFDEFKGFRGVYGEFKGV